MAVRGRIEGLEALRGLAALCVLVFHAVMFGGGYQQGHGYLAVDFFFMLSGFIMARTYEARMAEGLGAGRFLALRYRRLWPVMLVGGLIGLPVLASKLGLGGEFALIAVLNLLLVPTFIGNAIFPLNGPAWSILLELFANLAHALVLRRLSVKVLGAVAVLSALALLPWAMKHGFNVGAQPDDLMGGLPRVLVAYTIGVLFWRKWGECPPWQPSLGFTYCVMPVLFLSVALTQTSSWVFDYAFVLVVCPAMLAGGLAAEARLQGTSRSVARWAGAISFPLYAVHAPMIELAIRLGPGEASGAMAGSLASIVLASLIARVSALGFSALHPLSFSAKLR